MQEMYTMIVNNGVTLIITVIFLWQYIVNINKKNDEQKQVNKEPKENVTYEEKIIKKLDEIISLLKNIKK